MGGSTSCTETGEWPLNFLVFVEKMSGVSDRLSHASCCSATLSAKQKFAQGCDGIFLQAPPRGPIKFSLQPKSHCAVCNVFWVLFSGPQFHCFHLRGKGTTLWTLVRTSTTLVDTWSRRFRLQLRLKSLLSNLYFIFFEIHTKQQC